ncbi:DUF4400 domain-containing protein [Thiomicrorhabdus aquaedulcis]|uniref:DUF4400 domain-containing protein n=1 Tax=Thiomicrorhabdus aquaedulcis TaxID=2211106 RepID=UPI000FD8873D|nr:DUF4400 domain-containing protein [Thiomicrorhabdus aquaedulcis]
MNDSSKFSGWVWLITFIFVYFIGVGIWVGMVLKASSVETTLISERESNAFVMSGLDSHAWAFGREHDFFSAVADRFNKRIQNSKSIVDGKTGILEDVWDETPVKISLYGSLLDYRAGLLVLLLPSVLIVYLAIMIDGALLRKVQNYRNSFSSPLRHTIGGRVLGLNLGVLIVILFFAPFAIPFWVFTLIIVIKAFGWWLWVVNLPKRI